MSTSRVKKHKRGSPSKVKELTVKQQDFLNLMLADINMNATDAARKVGYSQPSVAGCKLMKNPVIQRELGNALRKREERTEIKQDEVLRFLHRALTLDPMDLFHSLGDGNLRIKDLASIPPEIRQLITDLECKTRTIGETGDTESTIKIKWVSKELALQLCMKHLGLLEEKLKVEGTVGVNVVAQLRKAVENKGRVLDDDTINGMVVSGKVTKGNGEKT